MAIGAPGAEPEAEGGAPSGAGLRSPRIASPHPRRDELLARFREAAGDAEPTATSLEDGPCRALVPFTGPPIQACRLSLLANGTAPAITVAYDCGEHTCSTEHYVWHGTESVPYHLEPNGALVTLEVSPDHRYLLVGSLRYTASDDAPPSPDGGTTSRIEFSTGKRGVVAPCLSPRLSPRGRWYACRDLEGDVLRFPVTFGALEVVVKADVPADDQVKVGGPFEDFPEPVEFLPDGRLRYRLYLLNREEVVDREAPFAE